MTADRLAALRRLMVEGDLDAMVVERPVNRRYLTGFSGSNGIAVVTADDAYLITDSRYYERVQREAPAFTLVKAGFAMLDRLAATLAETGARKVGLEADFVTLEYNGRLTEKTGSVEWVPTNGMIAGMRAVKSPDELATMTRAVALTDEAMEHAYEIARPGMTEQALAWRLESFMRERGAEGTAFTFIVAGGPNGALPHHDPSDRPLAAGEPIVVDMGARVDGYCADLTRTFSLGPPLDPEYLAVWDLVARANQVVVAQLTAGMSGKEADALARDLIAAEGHGDAFGHGLGHGVGLDIHELPRLGPAAPDSALTPGMVVTIEPGVYLPDRFGVRIEDLGVIRDSGVEILSKVRKVPTIALAQ